MFLEGFGKAFRNLITGMLFTIAVLVCDPALRREEKEALVRIHSQEKTPAPSGTDVRLL